VEQVSFVGMRIVISCVLCSVSAAAANVNWLDGWGKHKECAGSTRWSRQNVRVDHQKWLVCQAITYSHVLV